MPLIELAVEAFRKQISSAPQLAAANVNCRLLPDDSIERVVAELTKPITGDQVRS